MMQENNSMLIRFQNLCNTLAHKFLKFFLTDQLHGLHTFLVDCRFPMKASAMLQEGRPSESRISRQILTLSCADSCFLTAQTPLNQAVIDGQGRSRTAALAY